MDSCEPGGVFDTPLTYEKGWGKQLTYLIAQNRDQIVDVSVKYVLDPIMNKMRRDLVNEEWLSNTISAKREEIWSKCKNVKALKKQLCEELEQLSKLNPSTDTGTFIPRQSGSIEWRKERELPEWAQAIFSPHMVAAGNVSKREELDQLLELSLDSVDAYLTEIGNHNHMADTDEVKTAQNRYAHYQKQNPHTPKTMTSLGLDEEDVRVFVQECLFPDIE